MTKAFHIAFLLAAASTSFAQAKPLSCGEFGMMDSIERPKPPTCFTYMAQPPQQEEVDLCKSEMEIYVSKISNYLSCLKEEGNEAIQENNKAVRSYNCAVGGSVC